MMVKPVKKRAIQEWKLTEAEQPKEKVPEPPSKKSMVNHVEKMPRVTVGNILTQASLRQHFPIPPPGIVIPEHRGGNPIRNHYVEPMYIRPQAINGPTHPQQQVMMRPDLQGLIATDIGLPGRGAKRPQVPQDMAAVEAKASRKRRKPAGGSSAGGPGPAPGGTTELVMSSFVDGSVNGSVHINEKTPAIQPIILDFEVPLPAISPTQEKISSLDQLNGPSSRRSSLDLGAPPRAEGGDRRLAPDHGQHAQALSPVHSPGGGRDDDPRQQADPRQLARSDPRHPQKNSLFKKPDINHYKSSLQTLGTRCFICQNAIIPNPKDYPVAPSGLVICTKCRKLAMSGSPVAKGPPPKIHIPGKGNQSRSQPQQRIPRSPVAKSPAASLTLPRSPLPRSQTSRSPAPGSPLPQSSPGSPANTLSAPNSPASTSGLSVPGSPRLSAPSSPRYSAPSSPRNSAPSSPVSRPQGSPQPRNPGGMLVSARSPHLSCGSVSQPPSPRPMEPSSVRRHSISGTHIDVNYGGPASKASPTGSIGAVASPRSVATGDSPASMESLQLPPGREGDDATIRALLQLGRLRAVDSERRSALQGAENRIGDRSDVGFPKSLADMSKLDQAQLLELRHKLAYAGLPSRCSQASPQNCSQNGETALRHGKHQIPQSSGIPPLSKSCSPHSGNMNTLLKPVYHHGSSSQTLRSEGVVGSALPITALSSATEDAPLKISRVTRAPQERDPGRPHSPMDAQSRYRTGLESLSRIGLQCNGPKPSSESKADKTSKYSKREGSMQPEMYRGQYTMFQCHCSGSEMFFIKCTDCDFICNSIFGMELHIAAQRHAESRVPPPREVDYPGSEEHSGKESIADSEGSHSSFDTQSADTEVEGSTGGSPQRNIQEPLSRVYSPVPGPQYEPRREQPGRPRAFPGVVDLGSTVPHVNIPRYLAPGLGLGPQLKVQEPYSPLDLSGKRPSEVPQGHLGHSKQHMGKERRGGHEPNSPLDLSGYKHIESPASQFVSSQRLGSVGSVIEKPVSTSTVPGLALTRPSPQIQSGMPPMPVPGMMITGAPPTSGGQQHPYPIPTMIAVQPSSVAGLYPLSTLSGGMPLLAPMQFHSASAPPSPSHSQNVESRSQRRSSFSLAPQGYRTSKSASPTPLSQEPSRPAMLLTVPPPTARPPPVVSVPSSSTQVLNYQGGTITIQSSSSSSLSPAHQKTVTLESQFTPHKAQTPPPYRSSPHPSTPGSPATSQSSTPAAQHVKMEPQSEGEQESASAQGRKSTDSCAPETAKEDGESKEEEGPTEHPSPEKEAESGSPQAQSESSSPVPAVQIKVEPET
ncbi:uncharacterized protein [Diadema setosum]|uniref:uncharacterized protein n=1 Tax=Diadema setosum TaxID=31175 RepID=UPI003B3A7994